MAGQVSNLKTNVASTSFGRVASRALGSRVGRGAVGAAKFIGKATVGSKLRAAVTIGTGALAIRKYVKNRNAKKEELNYSPTMSASMGGAAVKAATNPSLVQRAANFAKAHPILTGAGLVGGLYVGEQIAEKLGVRGGAGFIGRRKKAKKRSKRRSRSKSSGRRVSFTTKDGRRVSFTPKRKGRTSLSFRAKRGRRGKGVSKTERKALMRLVRKFERD